MKLSDYIVTYDNTLKSSFCRSVCRRMELDERKKLGVFSDGKSDENVKTSHDLNISLLDDWKQEDETLYESLSMYLETYMDTVSEKTGINQDLLSGRPYKWSQTGDHLCDTGYQIKMYKPDGFYKWHHDYEIIPAGARALSFIWYLNEDFKGGETEFMDGTIIRPIEGRMVIFPSTWMYVHRGCKVIEGNKYIATGWFHHQHPYVKDLVRDEVQKTL